MIEMGKIYRTRDGRAVRIYAVDGGAPDQATRIHGAILCPLDEGGWNVASWGLTGRIDFNPHKEHPYDLFEVKPPITRTYWTVHHAIPYVTPEQFETSFDSQTSAEAWANRAGRKYEPVAITGPHEITFTEGFGL
jgi:hypothetical protein